MTKFRLCISAILFVCVAIILVLQHQAQTKLRDENQSLRQQMDSLQVENDRLSNLVAHANNSSSRPDDQLIELLKLRNEVRLLRQQTNEIGIVQSKIRQLQSQLEQLQAAQANDAKTQQSSEDSAAEQRRAFAIMKMNNARQFVLAMMLFADDNQHQSPTNFDQTVSYLGGYSNPALTNFTDIEIVYQGSWNNIANPASTIVARNKQAWESNGKWAKGYSFADGHSEIHIEPDGDFEAWEQQRMIPRPTNQ